MENHDFVTAMLAMAQEIETLRLINKALEDENRELRSDLRIRIHIEKENEES